MSTLKLNGVPGSISVGIGLTTRTVSGGSSGVTSPVTTRAYPCAPTLTAVARTRAVHWPISGLTMWVCSTLLTVSAAPPVVETPPLKTLPR